MFAGKSPLKSECEDGESICSYKYTRYNIACILILHRTTEIEQGNLTSLNIKLGSVQNRKKNEFVPTYRRLNTKCIDTVEASFRRLPHRSRGPNQGLFLYSVCLLPRGSLFSYSVLYRLYQYNIYLIIYIVHGPLILRRTGVEAGAHTVGLQIGGRSPPEQKTHNFFPFF